MCAVAGHVDKRADASAAPSASEASTRIKSGKWQQALTIASNAVRAKATRKPRASSWRTRRARESALASATSASGNAIAAVRDRITRASCVAVCNSDIAGTPFASACPLSKKPAAGRTLASDQAIDAYRDGRADDERDGVQIGNLAAGVESGEQQQSAEPAAQRARANLKCDEAATSGTAVSVRQRSQTAGTGGHEVEWGA